MNHLAFKYTVSAIVTFRPEEIATLMELSASHYDMRCKAAGKVGGFLYGLNNTVEYAPGAGSPDGTHPVRLDTDEVDLLCKILEGVRVHAPSRENYGLYTSMKRLLSKMIDEQVRVDDT